MTALAAVAWSPGTWFPFGLMRADGHGSYARLAVGMDAHAQRQADVSLVRRVQRGEAAAEEQLVQTLLPHLRVVARSILASASDVDDAIQISLMRVLDGLDSYRGDSSLVRWSRRVAAHACLRLREQNQRRLRVVEMSAQSAATTAGASPVPQLVEGLPRHVAEYLSQLPEVQREALILRHVLDHTVAEVAELVGAPVDTIKSRLLYARRAMRAMIKRDANVGRRREGAGG